MCVAGCLENEFKKRNLSEIRIFIIGLAMIGLLPAWLQFGIASMDATSLYIPTARLFALGDFAAGFSKSHPLYALLVYLMSSVTGFDFEISGRLVAAFNFILASLALFEITYKLSSDKLIAVVAALLLVFNPEFVLRSVDCLKESLIIALVLWANYFILFSKQNRLMISLGIFLLGLAIPLRSTVIFFVIGWLVVWTWHNPERRAVRTGSAGFIAVVVGIILLLNQDSAFLCANDFCIAPVVDYLRHVDISRLAFGFKILAEFIATGGYMVVIAGVFAFCKVNSTAWQLNVGCVLIAVFIVLFLMGWMSDRFMLLPLAWFYPAAAVGLVSWLRDPRKLVSWLAILTLISLPVIWSCRTFKDPNPVMVNQKVAGLWIKDQFGPNSEVYSNRPRLIFYADAKTVEKPIKLAAVDMHHREDAIFFAGVATSSGLVPVKSIGDIVIYQKKDNNLPAGVPDNKH